VFKGNLNVYFFTIGIRTYEMLAYRPRLELLRAKHYVPVADLAYQCILNRTKSGGDFTVT